MCLLALHTLYYYDRVGDSERFADGNRQSPCGMRHPEGMLSHAEKANKALPHLDQTGRRRHPVEFARLAHTFEELERTSSRLALIELLTQLFRSIERPAEI